MRRLIPTLLLLSAAPLSAQMGGGQFLRLCERDAVACAGILRDQLKGRLKHVLNPANLKKGIVEQSACPPHVADTILADQFVTQAEKLRIQFDGMTVYEAVEEVFTHAFPSCASSWNS